MLCIAIATVGLLPNRKHCNEKNLKGSVKSKIFTVTKKLRRAHDFAGERFWQTTVIPCKPCSTRYTGGVFLGNSFPCHTEYYIFVLEVLTFRVNQMLKNVRDTVDIFMHQYHSHKGNKTI